MKEKKSLSLPIKFLIGMILGVVAGFILGDKTVYISWIGTIFMRLLKMCVYPLVLLSIISGVANVVDLARLKKIGLSFLFYTAIMSTAAATIGVALMQITGAGHGVDLGSEISETESVDVAQSFIEWVPDNIFTALSEGNLIQIIVFAIFFGVVLASLRSTKAGEIVYNIVIGLDDIITKMVGAVIQIAPIGVFALVANMIGTTSLDVVTGIAKMLLAYYIALLIFLVVVLPLALKLVAKVSPLKFYRNAIPTMIMAASTCSSAGTLPVTMKTAKERCGVPDDIVNLIAAPAATINMNGAAVEYACYVLFAAHAFDLNLSIGEIAFTILLCVVMSAGAAGVPGGGIMMCTICLNTMGMPDATMVAIIAGIYILIDFVGTMINVTSDTVGMVTIAAITNELDRDTFNAKNED